MRKENEILHLVVSGRSPRSAQKAIKPTMQDTDKALSNQSEEEPREFDLTAYRALPKEERSRILRAQAEMAAAAYEADLALPVEERELTAFTALDGEPVYGYAEEGTPRVA